MRKQTIEEPKLATNTIESLIIMVFTVVVIHVLVGNYILKIKLY